MLNQKQIILQEIEQHQKVLECLDEEMYQKIEEAVNTMINTLQNDGAVFVMGNGGSAADSQHFVAEMVGRFLMERKPLRFYALTTNTSILTAIGNDYSFDDIFERQILAGARPGDVVIGISTSGNSTNIIKGIEAAKRTGCKVIGFTGKSGGRMSNICDVLLNAPSDFTPRIQEVHLLLIHIISTLIEQRMFGK